MFGNVGPLEIAIVLIIALIVFGPKRLPELGNSMGRGFREFKESVTGERKDGEDVKVIGAAQSDASLASEAAKPEAAGDERR